MANQGRFNHNQHHDPQPFKNEFKAEWIKKGIDKECVSFSDKFGRFLSKNGLTTSQIRNVYGELKRIEMKGYKQERTAFLLLKPKMAYAVARDGKPGLKQLTDIFQLAYNQVENEGHFKNLMDFMESILAYHKAYGGKN